jgi:hypothetical protein
MIRRCFKLKTVWLCCLSEASDNLLWFWSGVFISFHPLPDLPFVRFRMYRPLVLSEVCDFLLHHGATALVGQGLLIIEDSWSHSDTPHSVRLLWTSDQPDAETSTWHHTTLTRDKYPRPRRDWNPQSQEARGCRPTP